jgi:hypothetical protein
MSKAAATAITLSILFAASIAHAEDVMMPPPEYDYPAANVFIEEVPLRQVDPECRRRMGHFSDGLGEIQACAFHADDFLGLPATIIMPRRGDVSASFWRCLWTHENAHINLWPGDHPGGVWKRC